MDDFIMLEPRLSIGKPKFQPQGMWLIGTWGEYDADGQKIASGHYGICVTDGDDEGYDMPSFDGGSDRIKKTTRKMFERFNTRFKDEWRENTVAEILDEVWADIRG